LDIRKKFSFSDEIKNNIITSLVKEGKVTQCVLLCTCNRTEVYFVGEKGSDNSVVKILSEFSNVPQIQLSRFLMNYQGDNAVNHLFKVASGIDSMVVGEDEILSQTKSAYIFSKELNFTGYELNMIFQQAFACAKRIKTDTALSSTSISVATLVANQVAKFKDNVNVLLIGATGKIGSTVAKNILSHKNVNLIVTLRKHKVNSILDEENVRAIAYENRYNYIDKADCVISATFSPHYTVTKYDLEKSSIASKSRLFIDLAVPPDIDSMIDGYKGIELINIDHFENLAKANNEIRLGSVKTALEIIDEDVDVLKKDMALHSFLPYLYKLKSTGNTTLEKLIYKMKSEVNSYTFSAFLDVLKSMQF
jgi:glutamyl-tRNA reductase